MSVTFSGNAALLSTFGQPINLTPAGQSGAVVINGIWDTGQAARQSNGNGTYQLAGKLWLVEADLDEVPAKNSTVEIDSVVYRVVNDPAEDRDGSGGVWLNLRTK